MSAKLSLDKLPLDVLMSPHSAKVTLCDTFEKAVVRSFPISQLTEAQLKELEADVDFLVREKCRWMTQPYAARVVKGDTRFSKTEEIDNYVVLTELGGFQTLQDCVIRRNNAGVPFTEIEILQMLVQLLVPIDFVISAEWRSRKFLKHLLHPRRIFVSDGFLLKFDLIHAMMAAYITDEQFEDEEAYFAPETVCDENCCTDKSLIWEAGYILFHMMVAGRSGTFSVNNPLLYTNSKEINEILVKFRRDPVKYIYRTLHLELIDTYSPETRTIIKQMLDAFAGGRPGTITIYSRSFVFDCIRAQYYFKGQFDIEGGTPLMIAARIGDMNYIMACKDCVHKQNCYGRTALMYAAEEGNLQACRYLMNYELSMRSNRKWSALMFAAWRGKLDCVKELALKELGLHNLDGDTALILAAIHNNSEVVEYLMQYESNQVNDQGFCALTLAAVHCHLRCVMPLMHTEAPVYAQQALDAVTSDLCIGLESHKVIIAAMLNDFLQSGKLPPTTLSSATEELLLAQTGNISMTGSLLDCKWN